MQERARDVSRILDALPGWFGDRVDVDRAGVMGIPAGRSPRSPPPAAAPVGASRHLRTDRTSRRVKAIMGMAIGVRTSRSPSTCRVTVPAVLVAGGKDTNCVQAVSEFAFDAIGSADKLFVALPNATHRSFDSTYCAQLQSAGAAFDVDPRDGVVDPAEAAKQRPVLDRHTVALIGASAPVFLSGKAVHYCAEGYFTGPVDIRRWSEPHEQRVCAARDVCAIVPPVAGPPSACETNSIPCTGLDTDEVKAGMTQIAVAFFDSALKRSGGEGMHFTRYLAPKWLTHHVPMVGRAEAYAGPDASARPDRACLRGVSSAPRGGGTALSAVPRPR